MVQTMFLDTILKAQATKARIADDEMKSQQKAFEHQRE